MNRPNLTVVTRATTRKLILKSGRCVGVEYSEGGRIERTEASSEVILSAGAFGSPKLLMLSGIGNAGDLGKFGIKAEVDLPGVGRNLQDHLLTFIIHEGKKPLPVSAYDVLEAHFFAKSDNRRIGPDHQPLLMCSAPPLPYLDIPPNAYAIAPRVIRPASTGEVRLTSEDPDAPLYVDPGYLREEADVRCLVHSLEMSLEVTNATPFGDWRKAQIYPRKTDRASLTQYVREVSETYHHHAGTCKMGVDSMSVVDPELHVHGIDGLRVAGGGRIDHAGRGQRQHQRAFDHDRRKGHRPDPGRELGGERADGRLVPVERHPRLIRHAALLPRRVEDHVDGDVGDARNQADGVLDPTGHFSRHRAPRRRERHVEVDVAVVVDVDAVNQAKLIDVGGDFRVVDRLQCRHDVAGQPVQLLRRDGGPGGV